MWTRVRTTVHYGYDIFFRAKLLVLSSDEIPLFIDQLEKEALSIRNESMQLSWSMRGGAQYPDVMNMCYEERKMIAAISKENLEVTKKSGLPYF